MKKIVSFAFLLSIISLSSFAQNGISFEKSSWTQVIEKAKSENKLIFLDAYTSWCGPCKLMQAKVFPDGSLGEYFNENFVSAKVDMEKGEGPTLAAQFKVRGYPTLIFIDPNSKKVVQQVLGYRTVDQLKSIGKGAIINASKISSSAK